MKGQTATARARGLTALSMRAIMKKNKMRVTVDSSQ